MTHRQQGSVRSVADLVARGLATDAEGDALRDVAARFSIAISKPVLALIEGTGAAGPIGLQYVPSPDELRVTAAELPDPIGDEAHTPVRGIVHRYPDRVLLKLVHVCPVYCRFCFRRESVGAGGEVLTPVQIDEALQYIRARDGIWEVILSGGDPLVLSDDRLARIIAALNAIPHVQVIRIHTRYPLVEPDRITAALSSALTSRTAVYMVLHCNHASELTPEVTHACRLLSNAGVSLLSQSVLLAGVNDSADALEALLRGLVARRIKPYYLHHLDLAVGTGHFRVSVRRGQALMRHLRGRISGLCQPLYVVDIPGGYGKVPIMPAYIEAFDEQTGTYRIEDYEGRIHAYRDEAE